MASKATLAKHLVAARGRAKLRGGSRAVGTTKFSGYHKLRPGGESRDIIRPVKGMIDSD